MVPGQPTGVTATRKTSSGNTRKIDVAFTAPASGGSPTGYRLYSIPSAFSSPSTCKETAATSVTADRTACLAITALSTATACEAVLGSTAAAGIAAGATAVDAGAANSIELASADPSIYAGQKLRLADKSGQTCAAAPKGSDLVVASVSGAVITFTTDLTAGDSSANTKCVIGRAQPNGATPDVAPTVAPLITAVVGGSNTASVFFDPPTDCAQYSHQAITCASWSYTVQTYTGGSMTGTVSGSASPIVVTSLTSNTDYAFRVLAVNTISESSPASAESPSVRVS